MSPADIERVFGLGRLKMVTGRHVEVYREEARPGERRRYTKRFLSTMDGDFREWTEREWRILARLVGHGVACVPEVVQFDRGAGGGTALVQTYDAGITVDQWATLLPVQRDGRVLAHVFADPAHWWALARHALQALDAIHRLEVIHLDLKADNVCIPYVPPHFRPEEPGARLQPLFPRLALIDFAFSLVAGEALTTPLPIGRQHEYPYQSPRLLEALEAGGRGDLGPTRQLDWRCDLYSLVAMLDRYLPESAQDGAAALGHWNAHLLGLSRDLLASIRRCHDAEIATTRPHADLIAMCTEVLADGELAASLDSHWTLASGAAPATAGSSPTPVTRIAPPVRSPAAAMVTPLAGGTLAAPALAPIPFEGGPTPIAKAADSQASPGAGVSAPSHDAAWSTSPADPSLPAPVPPPSGALPEPAGPAAAALSAVATVPESRPPPSFEAAAGGQDPTPVVDSAALLGADALHPPARPAAMRRLAYPAVIVALVTAIVLLFTKGGAWDAVQWALAPDGAVRPAARPAPMAPRPVVAQPTPQPEPQQPPPQSPSPSPSPPQQTQPLASDFGERSLQLLAGPIHEVAGRTEWALARALALADRAEQAGDDAGIRQAVIAARLPTLGAEHVQRRAPDDARRLNDQARNALYKRRSVRDALDLQLRAFGANPLDTEIAGNLAYLHLIANPPQPDTARRLALHALTLRGGSHPAGRFEDWNTLAISSAMVGRDSDARRAFLLTLALTGNVEKNCRAALNSVATYGPRVRPAAEAMLARIRDRGQSSASPYCAWPPNWAAGSRFP